MDKYQIINISIKCNHKLTGQQEASNSMMLIHPNRQTLMNSKAMSPSIKVLIPSLQLSLCRKESDWSNRLVRKLSAQIKKYNKSSKTKSFQGLMMALNHQVGCTLPKDYWELSMSIKWWMLGAFLFFGLLIISRCWMENLMGIYKKLEQLENILLKYGGQLGWNYIMWSLSGLPKK